MRAHVPSVASAFVAAVLLSCCTKAPATGPADAPASRRVSFSLPSDDGKLVSVPWPGVTTVVDAWAPTCKPCRDKLPALYARRGEIEAHGGKLVLVAVLSQAESTQDARAALTSWGVNAPFLIDRGDVLRREAGVSGLPATLVIDERQQIRWVAPPNASATEVIAAANSR